MMMNNGFVVMVGDAINGHNIYGPYTDLETAAEVWEGSDDLWQVVPLTRDIGVVRVFDCDTNWCKHCGIVEKEK